MTVHATSTETLVTSLPNTALDKVLLASERSHYARARPGERLHELFERQCDVLRQHGYSDHLAVDTDEFTLTYDELDRHANQLAHHLLDRGVRPGHRVALLFDQPLHFYVGMLATLKVHAAYVPLDVGFPADRVSYIVKDSAASTVLSVRSAAAALGPGELDIEVVWLDEAADEIATHSSRRLTDTERGRPREELAYVIYTSGSTGRPKGVAIDHLSICNFVRIAAACYGYLQSDRVYQGLTIAFDFSVEEIWVPWMAGATLVPKPPGSSLLGADLHEFLVRRNVTAMCCVPTLLATLEEDVPGLRLLMVSGEACPQDLISRWTSTARRFLNLYGPTEATVTATWTTVQPDRPVTIGVPLPSYAIVILDTDDPYRALPFGEVGEIGIAGIGLARGYLNRDDLTREAFIPDFVGIPVNPSGRIYRTGDLGRINVNGEVEYRGRIDLQVKVRGYRIELTEIESVLLEVPGVAAAVVDTFRPDGQTVELVGYYTRRADTTAEDGLLTDAILTALRERLPAYMVPSYLEELAAIPMTTSDKVDRKNLPVPRGQRMVGGDYTAPTNDLETALADALASVLGLDRVSVTADLFTDLAANSLRLAQFASALRQRPGLPAPSIRQIYQNPTIRRLATVLGGSSVRMPPPTPEPAPAAGAQPTLRSMEERRPDRSTGPVVGGNSAGYLLCGAAQLAILLALALLGGLVADRGFRYLSTAPTLLGLYPRALVFSLGLFALWAVLPIVAKWVLIGRWKRGRIRIWSGAYLRFWLVRTLVRSNPMTLFAGSPLYNWYLRALGATIGRNVVIFSRSVPVATDLLAIGDNTVIRRNVAFSGYRPLQGFLQIGSVTLRSDVVVGDRSVLDIDTGMGAGAQLGHASTLSAGQRVPPGQSWHGTPGRHSGVDYLRIERIHLGTTRKIVYTLWQLLVLAVVSPVLPAVVVAIITRIEPVTELLVNGHRYLADSGFYRAVAVVSSALFAGSLLLGVLLMMTLPRLLRPLVPPGRTYPLYGIRYLAQLLLGALTNAPALMLLLGDSSFIVGFLRALGCRLTPVVQTGSNFGTQYGHDSPFLTSVGTGTVVSDGLQVVNMEVSNTSFRVDPVEIGDRNFLGNDVVFPAGARTGENVLLATKVMVPLDGPVRQNTGLLGSPAFEIPRTNPTRSQFGVLDDPEEIGRRLTGKNWHNLGTVAITLLSWAGRGFLALQVAAIALVFYQQYRALAIAAAVVVVMVLNALYGTVLERAATGFRRLRPRHCTIYDRYFWSHERLWKLYVSPLMTGTPFQVGLLRLAGVRIGRRVFDDGCVIPEKSLVTIGDDAMLAAGSVIQNHSLEDGVFASDHSVIGAGVTIGPTAFVHLGVTIGEGGVLDANAFLMKGSEMPPFTRWAGNPAEESPVSPGAGPRRRGTSGVAP